MTALLSSLHQTTIGGFRWCVAPELHEELFGPEGLRLPEWRRAGRAHVIKQGPHRVVYRVDLPELSFFVKHNLIPDRPSWLRELVRTSKARKEYERAVAVAARGVPTFQALAFGEQQAPFGVGESYLVTRSLDDTQTLNLFLAAELPTLPAEQRTRIRQRLATELGQFVARVHDSGVLHNDLHAANLLVRLTDDERIDLFLIDLNDATVGPPLDWTTSRNNLVMLNTWFVLRVGRSDRLRFWKAYFQSRRLGAWQRGPYGPKTQVELALDIEQRTGRCNLSFWRRRDRRCLRTNRYFCQASGGGLTGHAVTDLDPESLELLLRDPDALLTRPGTRLLKDSLSATVAELQLSVGGRMRPVIFKRFRVAAWYDPLASLFRPTPALRSWIRGHGFRERSLPTARPLAVLHRKFLGTWREGYLLTEKLEHADELYRSVETLQMVPAERRVVLLRARIEAVARVIREMHQRRVSHRDLKAANILVRRWDAPPSEPDPDHPFDARNLLHMPEGSVWLIDLVGVELFRRLRRRRKIQNLARLNASFYGSPYLTRSDRLRFLRIYLNWSLRGRGDWKSWWHQIAQVTEGKIARNIRRGRPLG